MLSIVPLHVCLPLLRVHQGMLGAVVNVEQPTAQTLGLSHQLPPCWAGLNSNTLLKCAV